MPRLSAVTSLVVLVLGCGPQRYATRTHFADAAGAWVREEGSVVPAPVLVGDARVFGLGEASHGARDVFLARAVITQELIEAGWARALVLESDAWDVCALDAYVHGRTHDVRVALGQVMGLYQHPDSSGRLRTCNYLTHRR